MRLMIIDDEPLIREILKKFLTGLGHDVEEASDGIECGARLFEGDFDVLLMDIMMPNQDGMKTIRYLRNGLSEKNKKIKIIIMTGSREEDIKDFLEKYQLPCLYKPIDLKMLESFIQN